MEDPMLEFVEPAGWKAPRGYSNGVVVGAGARLLFVAGQVAWDAEERLVGGADFAAQFEQALRNVVAVVEAAGGKAADLARVTVYVADKRAYLASTRAVGEAWRAVVGRHYPAMALVQVADLLETGALVEIDAVAALAEARGSS
jgi:enamine deaminase RidA (YjgF/YER057c/UK114 family)